MQIEVKTIEARRIALGLLFSASKNPSISLSYFLYRLMNDVGGCRAREDMMERCDEQRMEEFGGRGCPLATASTIVRGARGFTQSQCKDLQGVTN